MCGIVGATAERRIESILLEGLRRLEYRGYDSAGMAIINAKTHSIERVRAFGKVIDLVNALQKTPITGHTGIAHTRWATHGKPSEINAHPHISTEKIAIVHNGIIENHQSLREQLKKKNYHFISETDSEVIAHLLHAHFTETNDMKTALLKTCRDLEGTFAICAIHADFPEELFAIRRGSPLVIGVGIGENFVASDPLALQPVTQNFIFLEEDDIAIVSRKHIVIYDQSGKTVSRETHQYKNADDAANKGQYRHFMLKEIFEQPTALAEMLEFSIHNHQVDKLFSAGNESLLKDIHRITIIACGTSFHAGLIAKYWLESIAKIPTQVEIASEFRYRDAVIEPNTLFIAISQSGETADTLSAIRHAKTISPIKTLAVCNVAESSLSRESDLLLLTRSGKEVGVAATKTFTTQLIALAFLTLKLSKTTHADKIDMLLRLPAVISECLNLDARLQGIAKLFIQKQHTLFIARGDLAPIAAEGALKLKEISYIHAEAYPAGELKHGPIALIDKNMPVIVLAPKNALFEKTASNIHEIQARDGAVFVLSDAPSSNFDDTTIHIPMPSAPDFIAPIVYTIPLQLLAYHIAVLRGTDVDQPRNLAKSVTVE